jgi:two-component system chemotaxis sensor kinase CheA
MDNTELIQIFWTEVCEYIEHMNAMIMTLEMSTPDVDAGNFVENLRELNRLAHSMKGAARSVGIGEVEQLGFHMEEIFDASLKRGLALTPEICDLLYDALDLVQQRADGEDVPPDALEEVIGNLEGVIKNADLPGTDVVHIDEPAETQEALPPTNGNHHPSDEFPMVTTGNGAALALTPEPPSTEETIEVPTTQPTTALPQLLRPTEETVRVAVEKLDKLMAQSSELLVTRLQSEERRHNISDLRRRYGKWAREWRSVRAAYIRLARRLQDESASEDLRLLFDFLETNQRYLQETNREINALSGAVAGDAMRLSTLTDELQNSISSLRLVPFESILGNIQRVLRDAARETGKEVHLDVIGGQTEIDKTVLESLKNPIMHLIRNAVDHGIEPAAERQQIGKPDNGWIYLTVETRGSEIIVYIGDDGRGIDVERVRESAVANGIITETAAAALSDDEARALIFRPGLTTRDEVTPISGRGVGMDVVRTRVEGLRGRVSVMSEMGRGTTFVLSVPVSLTRIRSVLLTVGGEQYAVPALSVQRMERLPLDAAYTAEGRTVVNIGEHTYPLVALGPMLGAPPRQGKKTVLRVVVLTVGDRQVAFEVDDLTSERELVLKPLGPELENTRYVSGAALLGGGDVIIVLDANDLVRAATGTDMPELVDGEDPIDAAMPDATLVRLRVLIADDSITTRTLEKNILETAGCDVRVAFDGVQAWEQLAEHDFDVVVSDVEMPRMNGFELTERIRSSPAHRHLPVILLTSLNKPEHKEAGLNAGADAYLIKSRFDQDELLRTIQSVL